ncbi:HEPN domain-containing protein [Ensifer sp. LC163]|uniref:HEPN domain-containing protein n=1 Tax=Ensifer sp. LC163 TaxID=1120652 RepID=UPI000812DB40|nr:HEPN domain-containing protein [Ensifer sp. LC163]OCP38678.1 hypothetical protein BC360_01000 [Ensifer sp. LC163]
MTDWELLPSLVAEATRDYEPLAVQMLMPYEEARDQGPESVRTLIAAIEDMQQLELFGAGQMQWIASNAHMTSPLLLAGWLIEISRRPSPYGAEFAVEALRNYVETKTVLVHHVRPLAEVEYTGEPFEFSNGVTFRLAGGVPNGQLAYELTKSSGLPLPDNPTAMYTSHTHPIRHTARDAVSEDLVELDQSAQAIEDTILCLSLVMPADEGIFGMSLTCVADDAVPCNAQWRYWRRMPIAEPVRTVVVSHDDVVAADKLIKAFVASEQGTQAALRIAMRHLNAFGAQSSPIERAIHLRVALEAFFMKSDERGIRYKVSTRAASYLGKTQEEREGIRETFKTAYDATSNAVHSGTISTKAFDKLIGVAGQVQKSLRDTIMLRRLPDWSMVEHGG